MFKRVINNIKSKVSTSISDVGTFTNKTQKKYYKIPIVTKGLEEGDIVRVDGLPFLSRPSLRSRMKKIPFQWKEYKPVKLVSGY